jgi:hypothetical protein
MRQRVAGSRDRVREPPEATSTLMCMELRPVCTTRAGDLDEVADLDRGG